MKQQTMQQPTQQHPRPQQTRPQQRASQRPSQTTQRQEKPVLEFFHANEGKFKKLTLTVSQRGGVILRLSEKEGDGAVKSIAFSLNRTEVITLSREVEFYLMGVVKPTPTNGSGRASVVEFFHASPNGQYKKLSVETFADGGIALVLKQGEKGTPADGIVFALSRAEAIHLSEELKLLFYKGV